MMRPFRYWLSLLTRYVPSGSPGSRICFVVRLFIVKPPMVLNRDFVLSRVFVHAPFIIAPGPFYLSHDFFPVRQSTMNKNE